MKKRFVALASGFVVALSAGALMLGAALRPAPAVAELPRLWSAPVFVATDQRGQTVSTRTLRGQVWVAGFFYTRSTSIGPLMTAKMADLVNSTQAADVRFLSISVDPAHDDPATLASHAAMWSSDERWHFVGVDREGLAKLTAGMRTFVASAAPGAPIQHTSLFTLVDREGRVRGVYNSLDDVAMASLARDVSHLTGVPPRVSQAKYRADLLGATANPHSDVERANAGAALFESRGCVACHAHGRSAPPLANWMGRFVVLSGGKLVKADEAYARESILEPSAKIVAGFPALMPSYRGQLTDAELDQLVAYLKLIAK